jgi:hypothetical protein
MNTEFPENLTKEFLSDLFADNLEDWAAARKYGEFLTARCPTLLIGHLVLCRALRHMGDVQLAMNELHICKTIVAGADFRLRRNSRCDGTGMRTRSTARAPSKVACSTRA